MDTALPHTPGASAPPARPLPADRLRQVTVAVGALLAVAGAAVGSGAFGGQPIADAAGGALSADATPLAPDTPAFGIWSLIYTGLVLLAVFQALPRQATNPRLRATAWWVLLSMVLNAACVGVILALLGVLAVVLVRLVRSRPGGVVEAAVLDGTVGLYLGWVSVAALANIAAWLADAGVGELALGPTTWSVIVLTLGAALAVGYAVFARGRAVVALAAGAAMAWGFAWIAVGRTQGPLTDPTVARVAAAASVVALLAPVVTTLVARRRSVSPR
jgi:hypothetical protein